MEAAEREAIREFQKWKAEQTKDLQEYVRRKRATQWASCPRAKIVFRTLMMQIDAVTATYMAFSLQTKSAARVKHYNISWGKIPELKAPLVYLKG